MAVEVQNSFARVSHETNTDKYTGMTACSKLVIQTMSGEYAMKGYRLPDLRQLFEIETFVTTDTWDDNDPQMMIMERDKAFTFYYLSGQKIYSWPIDVTLRAYNDRIDSLTISADGMEFRAVELIASTSTP